MYENSLKSDQSNLYFATSCGKLLFKTISKISAGTQKTTNLRIFLEMFSVSTWSKGFSCISSSLEKLSTLSGLKVIGKGQSQPKVSLRHPLQKPRLSSVCEFSTGNLFYHMLISLSIVTDFWLAGVTQPSISDLSPLLIGLFLHCFECFNVLLAAREFHRYSHANLIAVVCVAQCKWRTSVALCAQKNN